MTTAPVNGNEPTTPVFVDGLASLAPRTPGTPPTPTTTTTQPEPAPTAEPTELTRAQKILTGIVVGAVLVIATLGFIGSYAAVTKLAVEKGFGSFAQAFPIAIDAGILAFLALDLLLTWRRIPYPLLRYAAWGLTGATIAFNAATAWPDPLGVGMHSVIPILFVIAVEAARHAIGRLADITADKHTESPPLIRWLLNPAGTFTIWRRMRMWNIRSYETVIELQREVRVYRAQLRAKHGRRWRRKATAEQLLVLTLAADGMPIAEAIELPHLEAKRRAEADAKRAAEARAEAEAKRQAELKREAEERAEAEAEAEVKHQAELRAAEAEAKRRAEVARAEAAEAEARLEVEAKRQAEAEAARLLVAETEAKLANIARAQELAEAEANLKRRRHESEAVRLQQEQQLMAAEARAGAARREREAAAQQKAQRITSEATSASASRRTASGQDRTRTTSASGPADLTGRSSKRLQEIQEVLAEIVKSGDPKSVSQEWVMDRFGLKPTTAYDRLDAARQMWAEAEAQSKTA